MMKHIRKYETSRVAACWLFIIAAMVFAMVIVGGATRLTGSGLSITEWKPISGALPPMSADAWAAEFARYRQIPQFAAVNPDMTLQGFKAIYWWEWTHRLLGRLIGLVFVAPFLILLWLRRIPRRLVWRCLALFGLGALQGLIGWWMVASGLVHRVSVAPERLAIHLSLALLIFCGAIWTGLEAWFGPGRPSNLRGWSLAGTALAAAVFLQIMLGGLVAGNHAGLVFNDWPLMAGRLFPADYGEGRGLAALLHSQAAVQFNHRIGAYLVFAGALALCWAALRSHDVMQRPSRLTLVLAVLVTLQLALGIATLMTHAALPLSLAHQCLAALVLAAALGFAWRIRRG
jgi:cytochrome c oxidase assembly protein subunit 15